MFGELLMSLEMGLLYGIIAIGVYLTFRVIDYPDLTCDGSFALGSAVFAVMLKNGMFWPLAILSAFFSGAIAGFFTSLLNIKFKITNLLSGILVCFMLYSVNLRIMGGIPNIGLFEYDFFYNHALILLTIIALLLALLVYVLMITDFGLALRSLGLNCYLARNNGLNTNFLTTFTLMLSNAIIALGGAIFSLHQGFADVGAGAGTLVIGLASVMIGESIFASRKVFINIFSCVLGSIIYRFFINIALHGDFFGLVTSDLNLITGILIILIMFISRKNNAKT